MWVPDHHVHPLMYIFLCKNHNLLEIDMPTLFITTPIPFLQICSSLLFPMTISCLHNYKIHKLVSCPWLLSFFRLHSLSTTKFSHVCFLNISPTHFILSNFGLLPESICASFFVSSPKFLQSGMIFLKSKCNYATLLLIISKLLSINSHSRTEYKGPSWSHPFSPLWSHLSLLSLYLMPPSSY